MLQASIDGSIEQRRWYASAGLSIVSAFPLDELVQGSPPSAPDVSIERVGGSVIEAFADGSSHALTIGEPGAPWVEIRRGAGGFYARWPGSLDVIVPDDGRRILVHERGELADSIARLLLCHAMSFVLPAHGMEGLHASAVEIDGRAVILAGGSGRGKSTLATALCQRGARLLSDDLTALRLAADGLVYVEPGSTRTWLWREVAGEMVDEDGRLDLRRLHKVAVGGDAIQSAVGPVPLAGIYLLGYRAGAPATSEPWSERDAFMAVLTNLFNVVIRTPQRLTTQFQIASAIAAHVPVRHVRWEPGPHTARALARQIIEGLDGPTDRGVTMEPIDAARASDAPHANGNGSTAQTAPSAYAEASTASPDRRRLLELLRAAGIDDVHDDSFDEPLLRTSQVAALLRTSDRTIRTWAEAGKLTYIKTLGGRRLFPASGVMAVLNEMRGAREEA